MSTPNTLWLASLIWLLAIGGAAALLGVRSWESGLTLALAATAPVLIAGRFWRTSWASSAMSTAAVSGGPTTGGSADHRR
jgi:hypothetical protein